MNKLDSPNVSIGIAFLSMGFVMTITSGLAIGMSFLTVGIVFMILGLTSNGTNGNSANEE